MARLSSAIDVHAHVYPTGYLDKLDTYGASTAVHRGLGADDSAADIDRRISLMDEARVGMQVLSVAPAVPAGSAPGAAATLAQSVNDRLCEIAADHPDRFAVFACLPLPDIDAALAEIDRVLVRRQVAGITVTSSIRDRLVTHPSLDPIWAELDRRAAPLFVHPAGCGALSPLINAEQLTWMVGAPAEDMLVVASLIARGHVHRYPAVKIIHSHLGGAVPLLLDRWDGLRGFETRESPIAPSEAARSMWYDTVTHGSVAALRAATEVLGADRLLFGTDFPYQRDEHYVDARNYLERVGLPAGDIEQITGATAARLLSLPRPS